MSESVREDQESRYVGNMEVMMGEDGLVKSVKLHGGTLVLSNDPRQVRSQLEGGERFAELPGDDELVQNVSTDAVIAARPDCYRYDKSLGELPLRTLSIGGDQPVAPGTVQRGSFAAVAAGSNWGCGSSREHAALSLLYAGIGVVYAPSFAPIHLNNLINSGMIPVTDRAIMERLMAGEEVSIDELMEGIGDIQARVMKRGGLFPFMEAWAKREESIPTIETPKRPMTIAEKIMAKNMDTMHGAVKPGDSGMLQVDVTLCHDYTTAQVSAMVEDGLGRKPKVKNPERHHSFPDHLTLIAKGEAGAPQDHVEQVIQLRSAQSEVVRDTGIVWHGVSDDPLDGADGICHFVFREQVVRPGQVVVGTDSHTCSSGAIDSYAFGVGSSNIATAWEHDVVQVSVPETVKIEFVGKLPKYCSGKDVMLYLAGISRQRSAAKGSEGVLLNGKVLEFSGDGLEGMTADDQWVLANMATECSAETGIVAPNPVLKQYLLEKRGMALEEIDAMMVAPDEGAEYADVITVDLSTIVPCVAKPGHTGQFATLDEVGGTQLDKAYSGSCTAGSLETLRKIAEVVQDHRVQILTHVQAGSVEVLRAATAEGIIQILEDSGITMIEEPGCGACLNAGPGGPAEGEVAISATNRNFKDRMGKGDVFLASPEVMAVAAILGHIPTPEEFQAHMERATEK